MSDSELISVVVPIYNVEKNLRKCLMSIIQQTYRNLEIILINDGSTDNSLLICEEFVGVDNRIVLINKPNGGLSSARNAGIDSSHGEYISFVDSDDYIHPKMIEKLYVTAKKTKSQVSICSFELVSEDFECLKKESFSTKVEIVSGVELLNRVLTKDGYRYVVVWNKLYHKNCFLNLRFDENRYYEDEYLSYKLFYDMKRVCIIDFVGYYYVQRRNSIVGSKTTVKKILDQLEMHKGRIHYYSKKNIHLFRKAQQFYCNWIIKSIVKHGELINGEVKKDLKIDFKEISKQLIFSDDIPFYYKIVDFIGLINFRCLLAIRNLGEKLSL